jgi:hypothetical protein
MRVTKLQLGKTDYRYRSIEVLKRLNSQVNEKYKKVKQPVGELPAVSLRGV